MGEYELLFVAPFRFVFGLIWELVKSADTGDILIGAMVIHFFMAWRSVKKEDFYYNYTQAMIYGVILMALLCLTN